MARTAFATPFAVLALGLAACGDADPDDPRTPVGSGGTATAPVPPLPGARPTPSSLVPAVPGDGEPLLVATLGDSISAGYPGHDPDPAVRAQLPGGGADARSQWQFWAARAVPGTAYRNCGVSGERTDQMLQRFDACVAGADVVVVQGGTNDIGQGVPTATAAQNLRDMVERGRDLVGEVRLVEVIPVNADPGTAAAVRDLNARIRRIARETRTPLVTWARAVAEGDDPDRLREDLTTDGVHPNVDGHRRLGEAFAGTLAELAG